MSLSANHLMYYETNAWEPLSHLSGARALKCNGKIFQYQNRYIQFASLGINFQDALIYPCIMEAPCVINKRLTPLLELPLPDQLRSTATTSLDFISYCQKDSTIYLMARAWTTCSHQNGMHETGLNGWYDYIHDITLQGNRTLGPFMLPYWNFWIYSFDINTLQWNLIRNPKPPDPDDDPDPRLHSLSIEYYHLPNGANEIDYSWGKDCGIWIGPGMDKGISKSDSWLSKTGMSVNTVTGVECLIINVPSTGSVFFTDDERRDRNIAKSSYQYFPGTVQILMPLHAASAPLGIPLNEDSTWAVMPEKYVNQGITEVISDSNKKVYWEVRHRSEWGWNLPPDIPCPCSTPYGPMFPGNLCGSENPAGAVLPGNYWFLLTEGGLTRVTWSGIPSETGIGWMFDYGHENHYGVLYDYWFQLETAYILYGPRAINDPVVVDWSNAAICANPDYTDLWNTGQKVTYRYDSYETTGFYSAFAEICQGCVIEEFGQHKVIIPHHATNLDITAYPLASYCNQSFPAVSEIWYEQPLEVGGQWDTLLSDKLEHTVMKIPHTYGMPNMMTFVFDNEVYCIWGSCQSYIGYKVDQYDGFGNAIFDGNLYRLDLSRNPIPHDAEHGYHRLWNGSWVINPDKGEVIWLAKRTRGATISDPPTWEILGQLFRYKISPNYAGLRDWAPLGNAFKDPRTSQIVGTVRGGVYWFTRKPPCNYVDTAQDKVTFTF